MAWRPERLRHAGLGVAAALLCAAALWLGTGLAPRFFLTWVAPWPVLAFAFRSSVPVAAAVAFVAWAGGALNLWHYLRTTLGVPLPIVLAAVTVPAAVFAGAVLLSRALARRDRPILASVALPAAWAAFEHLSARVSPHGTFGSLAYTQMDFPPALQLAAVFGSAGITFLLLLVPSALAVVTLPAAARARKRLLLSVAGVAAAALAFGEWRLHSDGSSPVSLRVALVAADQPSQPVAFDERQGAALVRLYAAAARAATAASADVVVLPETTVRASSDDGEALMVRLRGSSGGTTIVAGMDLKGALGEQNVALALGPGAFRPATYAKHHLLLPPESRYRAGTALTLVRVRSVPAGLAICKDLDFPRLGREYARRGVGLLLVPAWDFGDDGWLHSRMAVLRGVESGFAVARSARGGRLTISDDRGRLVADASSATAPVATAIATVRIGSRTTPYALLGDWFGWLCCAVLAAAALEAVRPGARRSAR